MTAIAWLLLAGLGVWFLAGLVISLLLGQVLSIGRRVEDHLEQQIAQGRHLVLVPTLPPAEVSGAVLATAAAAAEAADASPSRPRTGSHRAVRGDAS